MPSPAVGYNAALRGHIATVVAQTTAAWAAVTAADIDGSWQTAKPGVTAAITAGQFFGASLAYAFNLHLLRVHGLKPTGPVLRPIGFTGTAADGRPLDALLDIAPIRIKLAISGGIRPDQAVHAGLAQLVGVADSELQESARGVMDVAMNSDRQYKGYLRHPNPGACGRCLILAGKFYRTNDGFQRHPRCRCTHDPVVEGNPRPAETPRARFDGLSAHEQEQAFGSDGAKAVRGGADPAQVVNARRGMTAAGDSYTSAGTGRAARRGLQPVRLSPAGCRHEAHGDDNRYLELLSSNGYTV